MRAVYRGVVALVSVFEGRKIVGEVLRFIPLVKGGTVLTAGDKRLRVTRAKKGDGQPDTMERDLVAFAGRTVAADALEHDDEWLYGCVDMSHKQP